MGQTKLTAEYTTVATFTAAVVISAIAWISELLPPNSFTGGTGLLLRSLTATGTYLLIFKFTIFIYFKFIWQIVHRDKYVGGHWGYSYEKIPDQVSEKALEEEMIMSDKGVGFAQLRHTPEGIVLVAQSKSGPDNSPVLQATWESSASTMIESWIVLALESRGINGPGSGIGHFHIVTKQKKWWYPVAPLPDEIDGFVYIVGSKPKILRQWRVILKRKIE